MVKLLRTLNVKLLVPIICLWAVIFLFLFLLVLNPISDFVSNHIQHNMQWLANTAYTICDDSLDELIRSGKSSNPRYLNIKKVRTLKEIEVFFRQNDIFGFVYHSRYNKVLWETRLPIAAKNIVPLTSEYNQVIQLDLAGERYSGYHFSFNPWRWHLVLIKKTSHYATFINRVTKAYIATAGILFTSLVIILFVFNIVIKNPINKIITPLKEKKKPCYRGTVEFEFLSKNIEQMLKSLHSAKQDLEQRVEERTCELKQANDALKAAKEELSRYTIELEKQVAKRTNEISSILKYTPAVVYMKDIAGKYLLVNSRYEELFHVKSEDVRGKTDADLFPAKMAEQFRVIDERVLSEGSTLNIEEQIRQDDGVHTYLSVKFPIFTESGKIRGVCGIASDITATKKAHEQLCRLSANIMANQEKERAAIARELHDELGQAFTVLRMNAFWLKELLEKESIQGVDRAAAMCSLIESTSANMHNLAIRLRPDVLDDLGLVDALEWYIGDYERRTQIPCCFTCDDVPIIDETLATAAYRITQEALTNVARHANASRAEVDLKLDGQTMVLTICDDGCGFNECTTSETDELGLAGMRERAALVRGTLVVSSIPGKGTRVRFKVRLRHGSLASGF